MIRQSASGPYDYAPADGFGTSPNITRCPRGPMTRDGRICGEDAMGKQENRQIVETAKEARGAGARSDRPQRAGMEPWSRGGGVCRHLFHVLPDLSLLSMQHAKG
jgi:hypothetical protein